MQNFSKSTKSYAPYGKGYFPESVSLMESGRINSSDTVGYRSMQGGVIGVRCNHEQAGAKKNLSPKDHVMDDPAGDESHGVDDPCRNFYPGVSGNTPTGMVGLNVLREHGFIDTSVFDLSVQVLEIGTCRSTERRHVVLLDGGRGTV